MDNNDFYFNKMVEYMGKYSDASITHWLQSELFTWRWWFSVAFCVVPLYIWWKLVDRQRLFEIIIFGLFVNVSCSFLDTTGVNYALWQYPVRIVPNIPLIFHIDYSIIPITYMLVYQKFPKWKQFLISNTIISLLYSFLGEPLYVWAKMYVMINWKYFYSFPVYILIAIACKAAINWFIKKQKGCL